jgi:hypothetical protein
MHLENIGRIIQHCRYWRLVYDGCGHRQVFARVLASSGSTRPSARSGGTYTECLTYRLSERQVDPTTYSAE